MALQTRIRNFIISCLVAASETGIGAKSELIILTLVFDNCFCLLSWVKQITVSLEDIL